MASKQYLQRQWLVGSKQNARINHQGYQRHILPKPIEEGYEALNVKDMQYGERI